MKATVTKNSFQQWLESKAPSAQVGISGDSEKCPLAKYFLELNELKVGQVEVNGEIEISDKDGNLIKSVPTKPWMDKFVTNIDECGEDGNGVRISAKKALAILAEC